METVRCLSFYEDTVRASTFSRTELFVEPNRTEPDRTEPNSNRTELLSTFLKFFRTKKSLFFPKKKFGSEKFGSEKFGSVRFGSSSVRSGSVRFDKKFGS